MLYDYHVTDSQGRTVATETGVHPDQLYSAFYHARKKGHSMTFSKSAKVAE